MLRLHLICALASALFFGATGASAQDKGGPSPTAKGAIPESFQIRNKKYGDLLRPRDANGATGTRIVLYPAQPWKCMTWKLHPAGESAFQLQNHFTSKTFAANEQPAKTPSDVSQVPFSKEVGERPTWRFTKLADGTYKIADAKSGKVLTALKAEGRSEAEIVTEAWQEREDQKWELLKIDPKDLTM